METNCNLRPCGKEDAKYRKRLQSHNGSGLCLSQYQSCMKSPVGGLGAATGRHNGMSAGSSKEGDRGSY